MIRLYQLHWSHFVEKVQWALDHKAIVWEPVNVNAFTKAEMRGLGCAQLVPAIVDSATGAAVSESSSIIRYLDAYYPGTPALLPKEPVQAERVWRWMLWLDSELGTGARRLGYTQVIMECPQLLAKLFLPRIAGGFLARPGIDRASSAILGMVLMQRFRFHRNRADRVFERLNALLAPIARTLQHSAWLVGDSFSAADLTLASLLRPLRVVPWFRGHPALQGLFAWQERLFADHGRPREAVYETAIREQRQRRGWCRGAVRWPSTDSTQIEAPLDPPSLKCALNDQQPIFGAGAWLAPLRYFGLRYDLLVGRESWQP
jgi:glutathione S-transferase